MEHSAAASPAARECVASVPFPSAHPGSPIAGAVRKRIAPYTETGSHPEARGNAAGQAGIPAAGGWRGSKRPRRS